MKDVSIGNRMSSLTIAEETEKLHKNVCRDIRKQLDELKIGRLNYERTYLDTQKKTHVYYDLDYEQTMILISGYSIPLRAKVIARWQELEKGVAKIDELTEEELVQKALIIQQKKIKELSIKAQVAEALADTFGLYLPTTVGKIIMGKPNAFCQWLVDNKIMYRKGKHKFLAPMSPYDQKEKGYFKIKTSVYSGKSTAQSYFTPRGLCWVQAKYFKKNGLLMLDCTQEIE